jgi:hypothetical protein
MANRLVARLPVAVPLVFGGLLLVLALAVPMPYGPGFEAGRAIGDGGSVCARLHDSVVPTESDIPTEVELSRQVARPSMGRDWYSALLRRGSHVTGREGAWRAFAQDSIEIRWHHSPSVRLRIDGARVSGVVEPTGVVPSFMMLFERRRSISGEVVACPTDGIEPPDER